MSLKYAIARSRKFECGCKIKEGRLDGAFAVYPCDYHVGRLNRASWPLTVIERKIRTDRRVPARKNRF